MTAPRFAPRVQPEPSTPLRGPLGPSTPLRGPRRPVQAPPRPHLWVVGPGEARERRRARFLTASLLVFACAGLFAIVALRVLLAQGQVEIDRLEASIESATATQQDLRLTVAELEAPSQIVAAARQRLGMVPPPNVVYLDPPLAQAR